MKNRIVAAGAAVMLFLMTGIASGAGGAVVIDRVVAVVNDEVITMSDLYREKAKRTDVKDEKLVLEDMIDRKLQMAAAKRNGMDVSAQELSEAIADIKKRNNLGERQFEEALAKEGLTVEQYGSDLREQMTLSRLFNKYVRSGVAVDEQEARSYYERNAGQFALPEEVRVRLLLVKTPPQATADQVEAARIRADELRERLRQGEDLIGLIRQYSDSPTAKQDGDLGFIPRGHAIPEIEEASRLLKPGEYAGPFRTEEGYLIIRVEEIRTPAMPFEKVKDEIVKILFEQKTEVTYRAWLQTLRSDSHIENRL